jgi:hypothetical protein
VACKAGQKNDASIALMDLTKSQCGQVWQTVIRLNIQNHFTFSTFLQTQALPAQHLLLFYKLTKRQVNKIT